MVARAVPSGLLPVLGLPWRRHRFARALPAGRQRPERDAAGRAGAAPAGRRGPGPAGPAGRRAGPDRALRPARGRRSLDPARGDHGRRRAGRRPGRAPGIALVRRPAGRGAHALAQPARGRRSRAGSSRLPRCSPSSPSPLACATASPPDAGRGRWPRRWRSAPPPPLATAPLLAFHFERVSAVSLPANLLAVPAVAPAMWLGMVAAVAGAAWAPAGAAVNAVAQLPLAYLGWLAHAAGSLPGAELPVGLGSHVALAGAYAALVACWSWPGCRRRGPAVQRWPSPWSQQRPRSRWPARPRPTRARWWSRSWTSARATPRWSSTAACRSCSTPARRADRSWPACAGPGSRRLDVLVVTHAQADHEGEAAAVLRRHRVGLLVDGGDGATTPPTAPSLAAARQRGVRRMVPDAGQVLRPARWRSGSSGPAPSPPTATSAPTPTCVRWWRTCAPASSTCCCPPTPSRRSPPGLSLPEAEALKVAHHGSEDPGLGELVARVRPRLAVIEVGAGQLLRTPHPPGAGRRCVPCRRSTAPTATAPCA